MPAEDEKPDTASQEIIPAGQQSKALSVSKEEELLRAFIANQKGELEIKQKELEIRAEESKASSTFAHASLNAMAADRKEERTVSCKKLNSTYIFAGIVIALILALAAYALSLGKTEVVIQALDDVLKIGGGALAGWGFAQYQTVKKVQKKSQSEEEE